LQHTFLHIDMDAFYASIEQSLNPSLKNRPVLVGGASERGVVSAASYEARRFGVHSAMPLFEARRKCPQAVIVPVRMPLYRDFSAKIMNVLEDFSPLIEKISIDEAFMDISGTEKLWGPRERVARIIKERIRSKTSLSCSVGIAPLKFLAKIASDMQKPDGLTIIRENEVDEVIRLIPLGEVPGVGDKMKSSLRNMGLRFLGDLKGFSERDLVNRFGIFGRRLYLYSRGIDRSVVKPNVERKSVSSEDTFSRDTSDQAVIRRQLLIQSETVGQRLRNSSLVGRTITLKLKTSDFRVITRNTRLARPTDCSHLIYSTGCSLLEKMDPLPSLRLIGIGVSQLLHADLLNEQMSLFSEKRPGEERWRGVERAMDRVREKFGDEAIRLGSTRTAKAAGKIDSGEEKENHLP